MRRYEKKAILEMLDTIEEAHREYRKYKEKGDTEGCIAVLTACQESAISIGSAIEKSEGEGTDAVRLLEQYCEDLYQLSQGQDETDIDKDLTNIRDCINDKIPVVLEVVFFPYKASMWDSMESIYLAFKEREDVNTWLVPIPYYNRNHDGTVDQMHCESDLFPEDEEVTDWRAFNVAKVRPDIAFIHNPYDDLNFVTTVDPAYYSFELKKYVDCLVYCPYFSTLGGLAKGQNLCKAYLYADYILAQSDVQVECYDQSIPREKFIVAGSPKFDKVIRLTKEKNDDTGGFFKRFPEEWYEKCRGKKIYFYNTSIAGLLADTPVFLEKMNYIFKTFEKNDSVILWWRPHPLLESTLEALRPDYLSKYNYLKKYFMENNVGIMDNTSDVSASVAACDVFIGDYRTSIISLFSASGKPVVFLNNNILREPHKQDIIDSLFTNIPLDTRQEGYLITGGNQLYKFDPPIDEKIEFHYVRRFSGYSDKMYDKCYRYEGNLYITPLKTEQIVVYDKNGTQSVIQLKHCTEQWNKFFFSWMYKHFIFLFPDEYPYIVRVDLETGDILYSSDIRDIFIIEKNSVRRSGMFGFFDDKIVITSPKDNRLAVVDITSLSYRVISVGENMGYGYSLLYFQKNREGQKIYWMIPYRGISVRRFNCDTGDVDDFKLNLTECTCSDPDQNGSDDVLPFSSYIVKDDFMYLAPCRGDKFAVLDLGTGESHEWEFPLSIEWQGYDRFYTGYIRGSLMEYKGDYYWFSATERRLYEIAVSPQKAEVKREIKVEFDVDEILEHAYGFSRTSPLGGYGLNETSVNPLSGIISANISGSPFDKEEQKKAMEKVAENLDGTCGRKVCDMLMSQM